MKNKNKVTSVGEEVGKFQHLCTAGQNVKWCNLRGKQQGGSLKP